jgi:AcrR family transcriptional regulator
MSRNPKNRDSYHHGNLPDTLIKDGAELLAEVGVEGFSLRKLALRTGVTVAAPSHHFGSARGLLTAIATEGFERLAQKMKTAALSEETPEDAVFLMCNAYYETRVTDAGYATVMFRLDLLDATDERFMAHATYAFGLLEERLAKAASEETEAAQVSIVAKALWATTHGLSNLPMIEDRESEQIIRSTVNAHIGLLRSSAQSQ